MKIYKILPLLISVTSLFFVERTGAQDVMSLEKAISMALENNFQIKIAETDILVAENNNTWARAGKYPTIDLNGTLNATLINDNNPASFLNGTFLPAGLGASLDVQWVPYNGGRIKINKDQFELAISQAAQVKDTEIQNLLRDVSTAYYEVIFQQERMELLEETLKLSKDRYRYEDGRRQFGGSNSFNLIQFEEAILTDSLSLITQVNVIETSKRQLYDLLTISIDQNYRFLETLSVQPEEPDAEKLKSELDESNLTLRSLALIEELQILNTALAESQRKPVVTLGGTLGSTENYFKFFGENPRTGETIPGSFARRINLGVNAGVRWNLFDGGVRKSDIENAKLQEEIARMDILSATQDLYNQIDILVENYNAQLERLQLAEDRLNINQRNIDMAIERYKLGRITSIDYRNVQNLYLVAAFAKVSAIYELINTKIQLDWLVGRYATSGDLAN